MFDLVDPFGSHCKLPSRSGNNIPHIILHDGLILLLLRTKYQYSIEKPRKSTQRLEKEIISDNKPLQGGNLLLPHLNVQVQDDSK
jgi:hypothetical protein